MKSWLAALPFALALLTALAPAQDPPGLGFEAGEKKVTVKARFDPPKVRAGEVTTLILDVAIEPGWHLYGAAETGSVPTTIDFDEKNGLEPVGKAQIPDGNPHTQVGITSYWIETDFQIKQTVVAPKGLQPGDVKLEGIIDYMACTEAFCDPQDSVQWEASLAIEAGEARPERMRKKVRVEARFTGPARAGETAVLELKTTIDEPWHIYGGKQKDGFPTKITITKSEGLTVGKSVIPDGEPHGEDLDRQYWLTGEVVLKKEFAVPPDAKPGRVSVEGKLEYMPCTKEICDDATDVAFAAELVVEEGEARAAPPVQSDVEDPPQDELAKQGFWKFLLLAIGGGLFALVMPCTYPMIPITISFFTKQAESRGGNVLPLALLYGAGIVGIFTLLGVLFQELRVDKIAFHPITNTVVTVAFFVFALSLFGLINLQPPKFLMNAAGKASTQGGLLGVFLMGATLVITSFTCTAPFVGTVIAAGATQGKGVVALGMGVFGLTMAIPFVLLSLMPGKLQSMPRSGQWMNTVKVTLGFVELAAALKFLSNVDLALDWGWLSRELFLSLWAGIFAVTTLYLLGMFKFKGETGEIGPGRLVAALFFVFLTAYSAYGALGNRMDGVIMTAMAPPYSNRLYGAAEAKAKTHVIVTDDYDEASRLALAEGKKLFVNFTGHQ